MQPQAIVYQAAIDEQIIIVTDGRLHSVRHNDLFGATSQSSGDNFPNITFLVKPRKVNCAQRILSNRFGRGHRDHLQPSHDHKDCRRLV